MLDKFQLLKTKKIISILDGDEVLGRTGCGQAFGTYEIELRLP